MNKISKKVVVLLAVFSATINMKANANGEISEHVNNLSAHLTEYAEEVTWLSDKFSGVVDEYSKKGKADSDQLIEFWEEVDFHSAIETQYVPVYATIWQGIYGVKVAIDSGEKAAVVEAELLKLKQALWQGLGAVKLAAQYQQKGLVPKVMTTEQEPTTGPEVIDDIKKKLHRVVAKYAEKLTEVATTLVHDTYLQRFEGIEGALIELDAELVEDLEKDFNVTLPQAISKDTSVDNVRAVVETMQVKLDKARSLLVKAEESRKSVF